MICRGTQKESQNERRYLNLFHYWKVLYQGIGITLFRKTVRGYMTYVKIKKDNMMVITLGTLAHQTREDVVGNVILYDKRVSSIVIGHTNREVET